MITSPYDAALTRLCAIDWNLWGPFASNYRLLLEYLRRMALWADALQIPEREHRRKWAFFDIAQTIAPEMQIPREVLETWENFMDDLWESKGTFLNPMYDGSACEHYLRWAGVKDLPSVHKLNLPEPYEPLILMFERGAHLRSEHAWLELNVHILMGFNWDPKAHYSLTPVVELDTAVLDEIDAAESDEKLN